MPYSIIANLEIISDAKNNKGTPRLKGSYLFLERRVRLKTGLAQAGAKHQRELLIILYYQHFRMKLLHRGDLL